MDLLNLNTDGISTMNTKDALIFASFALDKFRQAHAIYIPAWLIRPDRVHDKMTIIEAVCQIVRNDENKTSSYYKLTLHRGNNFECVNAIIKKEVKREEFTEEVKFINRFNEY